MRGGGVEATSGKFFGGVVKIAYFCYLEEAASAAWWLFAVSFLF